jgi:hypothetical protein
MPLYANIFKKFSARFHIQGPACAYARAYASVNRRSGADMSPANILIE